MEEKQTKKKPTICNYCKSSTEDPNHINTFFNVTEYDNSYSSLGCEFCKHYSQSKQK